MSWNNLKHYIQNRERTFGLGKKYKYIPKRSFNAVQTDSELAIRAIFYSDIKTLRKSKLDYSHIAEFYIHKILWELQREFIMYDVSYQYVREWAAIRYYSTLKNINRIRQKYWYFKLLNF